MSGARAPRYKYQMRYHEIFEDSRPTVDEIAAKHAATVRRPFGICKAVATDFADDLKRHGYPAEVLKCEEGQFYALMPISVGTPSIIPLFGGFIMSLRLEIKYMI